MLKPAKVQGNFVLIIYNNACFLLKPFTVAMVVDSGLTQQWVTFFLLSTSYDSSQGRFFTVDSHFTQGRSLR